MENEVSAFLKTVKHPLMKEIEALRKLILHTDPAIGENIKWNGPNFYHQGRDKITLRIHPSPQLQMILHRGAKVLTPLKYKLIKDDSGMLVWKGNDRAIITFQDMKAIKEKEIQLKKVIKQWLAATTEAN